MSANQGELTFELDYRPPYDWAAMLAFLATRSITGVEAVEGSFYRRTVKATTAARQSSGWIEVTAVDTKHALRVTLSCALADAVPWVLARVQCLLDLSCEPEQVAASLGSLAKHNPGIRVPRAFDGFEMSVRAVLGQQVTVAAARTLAGRIAARYGEALDTRFAALTHTFPAPEIIAAAPAEDIGRLGIIRTRVATIQALAAAIRDGELTLEPGVAIQATIEKLRTLPGIGEWTAQYIAMRALAWPDAFPHTDLGVIKALGLRRPAQVLAAAEAWRPWRSYAVMHLWRTLK